MPVCFFPCSECPVETLTNENLPIYGLILYPPVKKFECLKKSELIRKELPESMDYIEYAIDINGDSKPEIAKYSTKDDSTDVSSLWIKNEKNEWKLYERHSSKNYQFDKDKDGFYPASYFCD